MSKVRERTKYKWSYREKGIANAATFPLRLISVQNPFHLERGKIKSMETALKLLFLWERDHDKPCPPLSKPLLLFTHIMKRVMSPWTLRVSHLTPPIHLDPKVTFQCLPEAMNMENTLFTLSGLLCDLAQPGSTWMNPGNWHLIRPLLCGIMSPPLLVNPMVLI